MIRLSMHPVYGSERANRIFLLALLAFLVPAGAAFAQVVDQNLWVANGEVRVVVPSGGKLHIGGNFTMVSPATGGGVPVSKVTGAPLASVPKVVGRVDVIVSDGADGWYIGGLFTSVGGFPRANLAHLASDWSVTAWNPGANHYVSAIAVYGSTVYVGGNFTEVGGQARNRIAALDATTGLATGWDPNANGPVSAIRARASTVYVGGGFTTIGGASRSYLTSLDASTGAATGWNPSPNAPVNVLIIARSALYVGGGFTTISGGSRGGLASYDFSGDITAWNPNTNGEVLTKAIGNSLLYLGGTFTSVGGVGRNFIASVDASSGVVTAWNPDANFHVRALAYDGSTIYAGGGFWSIGGQSRNRIAALDATGAATAWNPIADNWVWALAVDASAVYVGGPLTGLGGKARNNVAALDLSTGEATDWNPQSDGTVLAIAPSGSVIYLGGSFGNVGGELRSNIAAVDATSGSATTWDPGANNPVNALAVSGPNVYVGGAFTTIAGQSRGGIAAISAATGAATPWSPVSNGQVNALMLDGGIAYVGGRFSTMGGQPRNNAAAVDLVTGSATAWNPNADDGVACLARSGSIVYMGGDFANVGGQPRNRGAACDATTGAVNAWNPNANEVVLGLAPHGPNVYAAGIFWSIGGQTRGGLAALDGTTGAVKSWDPAFVPGSVSVGGVGYAVALQGSNVIVGGLSSGMGLYPQANLASVASMPAIVAVSPASGGNAGPVTVTISGVGFRNGAFAKLSRTGQTDILGTQVSVAAGGEAVTATFDLSGKAAGAWDVLVTNPDLQTASLSSGFMVQSVAGPQLTVSIVGPDPMRAGVPAAFDIVVENPGNVDAIAVPVWVTGIPPSATVSLGFVASPPPQITGEPDWSTVPATFTSAGGQYLPLLLPRVPPGTMSRRIYLTVPASVPQFDLGAAIGSPWADEPGFRGCMGTVVSNTTCMGGVLAGIQSHLAANPQLEAMSGTGVWAKESWQCEGAGTLATAIAEAEQALDHLALAIEQGPVSPGCEDALLPRWRHVLLVHVVTSIDPNDKLAPQGPVSSQQAIPYSVRFENLASAGASAQKVTIADVLANTLDLNTFTLDAVAFGNTRLVPPPGVKQYTWDVDLGPTRGIIVRVVAGFTPSTPFDRTVVWTFVSLDRTTGQPLDPASLNGFLPPNVNAPEGEGSVLFTVRPSGQVTSGTQIQNVATINFDGAVLTTPAVSNVLDSQPPASNVLALGNPIGDPTFTVSWQGSGDGLRDYTVYVAQDGGPYQVWKLNTVTTSGSYTPQKGGHDYSFYSVARDMTGNIEPAPPGPDAQTHSTTAVGDPSSPGLTLLGSQPNPAKGVLRIGFSLPSRQRATLELIDVAGRRVVRREVGQMGAGSHVLTLGSRPDLDAGIYFVRLVQEGRTLVSRVVLLR